MKKAIFFFASLLFFPYAFSFAASGEAERLSGSVSFDATLNNFLTEYSKGLAVPSPVPSEPEKTAGDDRLWITVSASDSHERTRLLDAGMDIVEIDRDTVSGTIPRELLPALADKSFRLVSKMPLSSYLQKMKDFPAADAAYHNYNETEALMRELAAKNKDLASMFSIGKTVENRDIWCLRINSSERDGEKSSKPGAVYVGAHHAREHLSTEVPLLFAVWLLDNRNDPQVAQYLKNLDIYIIPMMNPDGVEYDIASGSYKWQRKNRRINDDKSVGVDLNRNYDSWFGGAGTSHNPKSDTYCGPSAFSEPESAAFKRFIEARGNLKTMITYHSYSSSVLYPYGGSDADISDARDLKAIKNIAQQLASLAGYKAQKSSDLYVATGDTADWAYDNARILGFTIELEGKSFYPGAAAIEQAVKGNVKAAAYLLSVTADPYK